MPLFDALNVYAAGETRSAAMNMAIDEALLETVSVATLRFYGWRAPAISFGYFGRFADVANESPQRELVRRWTGGGIVYHGEDLTYSLALPGAVAMRFASSRVVYAEVHGAIRETLSSIVPVALASAAAPKISDACFANPVESDVLLNGRKIAGAAQRRTRNGLLHQGSIQHDGLPADFTSHFAAALCPAFSPLSLSDDLFHRAEVIADRRYGTAEWLQRR